MKNLHMKIAKVGWIDPYFFKIHYHIEVDYISDVMKLLIAASIPEDT